MAELTSISLLERVADRSDSQAWERFAEIYAPLLRRWLRAYDVQEADADDLVQDVLAVVARELPAFRSSPQPGAFRCWLRTVLVHRLRNFWRSRQHRPLATGATASSSGSVSWKTKPASSAAPGTPTTTGRCSRG